MAKIEIKSKERVFLYDNFKGDSVCYLSGDNICHSTISKITIEISYTDRSFFMVYKLSDGLSVPRNNYPQWDKKLFRDKDDLIRYLSES